MKTFVKNVEKMIDPMDVGTIHFMQTYFNAVPPKAQYNFIKSGSKKNPYMGLVVEPYSLFLCYEIVDIEKAQRMIPDGFKLIKTKVAEKDEPKYYCIFGCFNVHTSAFWGTRLEFYVIAENEKTGMLSWVIIDVDTDTVSFDEKKGLSGGNTTGCVFTSTYEGNLITDIQGKDRKLMVSASILDGHSQFVDERLWVEGNLSVAYGPLLADDHTPFSVAFYPKEFEKGLVLPSKDVSVEANTWYPGLFEEVPSMVLCFPFAQHFVSDSPGYSSNLKTKEEVLNHVQNLDFSSFPHYSSKPLKKAFKKGQLISTLTILLLIILLILK